MTEEPRTTRNTSGEPAARIPAAARTESHATRVVVVGNGMVGFRLCERLAAATDGRFQVTVFGEESSPAYDRIRLTDGLVGDDDQSLQSLLLAPGSWYAEHHIELYTADEVIDIDRETRQVCSARGRVVPYDVLVLATGSAARVPPVAGIDTDGVLVYRTLADVQRIRARARAARRALVLGGGLLGVEAAGALRALGLAVTVVEAADQLMPRQLGAGGGAALARRLETLGIGAVLSERAQQITAAPGGALRIVLTSGRVLAAELVVLALGVRARDELAARCGLAVAAPPQGGVLVDDGLRTSDPHIHAIGECAAHRGTTYGLAAPGLEMAEVLAARLLGQRARFRGADRSCTLKLAGVEVAVLGDVEGAGRRLCYQEAGTSRTLVVQRGRVAGAEVVGAWSQRPRLELALASRERLRRRDVERFTRTGDAWADSAPRPARVPDAMLVCGCVGIRAGAVREALAGGAATVDALGRATGAGTRCGSCRPLLAQLSGTIAAPSLRTGHVALAALSVLALAGCLAFIWPGAIDTAGSMQSSGYRIAALWRDHLAKQVSGFALVGVAVLGLALSLRKRTRWLRGSYRGYRLLHGASGAGALALALAHTGLGAGHNLNRALLLTFLAVQLTGAALGGVVALESSARARVAGAARRSRPNALRLHIVALWALPPLLAFHILSVYYY